MADPGKPPPYNYGAIPTDSGNQPPPPYPATGIKKFKCFEMIEREANEEMKDPLLDLLGVVVQFWPLS